MNETLIKTCVSIESLTEQLNDLLHSIGAYNAFMFCDNNTQQFCLQIKESLRIKCDIFCINDGEENKSLDTVRDIWTFLVSHGGHRNSLMINVGGGVVTDVGGFAAACYKRGIRFINIPTTLLGAADASIGGKTGINFCGLKNEIGAFANPTAVFLCPEFFKSLSLQEIQSGVGELSKLYYIAEEDYRIQFRDFLFSDFRMESVGNVLHHAIEFKQRITTIDPLDCGIRKCLNFGHTAGHALESLQIMKGKPVAHGIAVAHGILIELILSKLNGHLEDSNVITQYCNDILKMYFPMLQILCSDYEQIISFMHHDKKNTSHKRINYVAIKDPGRYELDAEANAKDLEMALDLYRDMLGI